MVSLCNIKLFANMLSRNKEVYCYYCDSLRLALAWMPTIQLSCMTKLHDL